MDSRITQAKILKLLPRTRAVSSYDLAARTGLHPTTCRYHLTRLVNAGDVKIDAQGLGRGSRTLYVRT